MSAGRMRDDCSSRLLLDYIIYIYIYSMDLLGAT